MGTPVDKRIIKGIVQAVNFGKKYAVSLAIVESFVKAQGRTEGEGYRLLGDFYDALNEGKLKGVYLMKLYLSLFDKRDFVFFISPVVLSSDQWETLNTLVAWVKGISSDCKKLDVEKTVESVIDSLIATWSGERYDTGLYKFAINNGITSESDLADLGIKIPSPTESSKTKEGGE